MKKAKNWLIIVIFAVIALLIFIVLLPAAMTENKNLESQNNIDNNNAIAEINDDEINQIENSEDVLVDLNWLTDQRETEIENNINSLSSVESQTDNDFEITKITWLDDNTAEVEYNDGENDLKAQFVFNEEQPIINLVTQIEDMEIMPELEAELDTELE